MGKPLTGLSSWGPHSTGEDARRFIGHSGIAFRDGNAFIGQWCYRQARGPLRLPSAVAALRLDNRVEKKLDLWRGWQARAIAFSEADTSHCSRRHSSVSLVLSS